MQPGCQKAPRARIALLLIGLLLFSVPGALAAKDASVTTVRAVGGSLIQGSDMSASRSAAIADGLLSAIARVLMDIIPDRMAVGHFQVLSETILSNVDPYILNYEMLTESIIGRQHRVMVRVNVSKSNLMLRLKEAGIYLTQKRYPRLLYCIAEKQSQAADYQYWWGGRDVWAAGAATDALSKTLSEKGFGVAQPGTITNRALQPELSAADAVLLGQQAGAEVVIVGWAVAEAASNTMGASLQSYRGTIAARAFDVRSGQEVAQVQQIALVTADDPATGSREALGSASSQVADGLASQISKAWFADEEMSSAVEIMVEGISGNVASFVKFRGVLSTMSGVDSVQRKEMLQDAAVLLVDYQGSARALADALMRQSFDAFGVNIDEPEGNKLRLQLIPR